MVPEGMKDEWTEFCHLVIDYIYDVTDGMNNDPFYDPTSDNQVITLNNLTSYYKYKYNQYKIDFIPSWLKNIKIYLDDNLMVEGKCNFNIKKEQNYKNYEIDIYLHNYINISPNDLYDTLAHEISHIHDTLFRKTVTTQEISKKKKNIIDKILSKKMIAPVPIKNQKNIIKLDLDIFNDIEKINEILFFSAYFILPAEINAFKSNFKNTYIQLKEKNTKIDISEITIYKLYYSYCEFWKYLKNNLKYLTNSHEIMEQILQNFDNYYIIEVKNIENENQLIEIIINNMIMIFDNEIKTLEKNFKEFENHYSKITI